MLIHHNYSSEPGFGTVTLPFAAILKIMPHFIKVSFP
jgi:hypothetical protein